MTTSLPVVGERRRRHPWRARLVHLLRVAIVVALLLAIPSSAPLESDGSVAPTSGQMATRFESLPSDWKIGDRDSASGLWQLTDADGESQGWVARTLPAASDVVGYRGPTEAMVVLGSDLVIRSVALLSSEDTEEHVAAVSDDREFFQQFRGWEWTNPKADVRVDGVSGATLTSLALAEGILSRMGGARPSLLFPDPLAVEEIKSWYPTAQSVDDATGWVLGQDGQRLGRVIRTGRYSDDQIGYQGPTELMLRIDDGNVAAIRIRRSFDNEPYVDYVRTEYGFWKLFVDRSIEELAEFDPEQSRVEGVSGATMTSVTVADTVVSATRKFIDESKRPSPPPRARLATTRWAAADLATITMICLSGLLSLLGAFRHRILRRLWLVAVVVVIGLWAGNLVSLALIAGWSAEGVAWRLAPGLAAIVFVALIIPPLRKGNPYCNHLCPHGSLQQLIKPGGRARRHLRPSRSWTRRLTSIPGWLLVIAYVTLICRPSTDLSSWEPFHAYLFRIAGWGALLTAALSLALAAVIPMGYCRFGCPTGRLIDYVRLTATSDRIKWCDLVAAGLLLFALAMSYLSISLEA